MRWCNVLSVKSDLGLLEAGHRITFRGPIITSTREERTMTCHIENNHFDLALELLTVNGFAGVADAVSLLITTSMQIEQSRYLQIALPGDKKGRPSQNLAVKMHARRPTATMDLGMICFGGSAILTVGPSVSRPSHCLQAYWGRTCLITLIIAGIISNFSETSSPIRSILPPQP